jgi:hypothetical protein
MRKLPLSSEQTTLVFWKSVSLSLHNPYIPPDFPNMEFICFYLTPVTSQQSKERAIVVSHNPPDVVGLTCFVEDNFLWGDLNGILKNFSTLVFPGLALYELI